MNLPINGRIAIIDDQILHAQPLIKVFSQKQLPHTYFSGEVQFLPTEDENLNDIRILFLDINLIDNGEHSNTVLKGRLFPVLNRVISKKNYPYIIIYWSRHETHKKLIEDDIFGQELANRKPIGYLSAVKSDFFDLTGDPTPDFDENLAKLFEKINNLLSSIPSYRYLLNWENQVHKAADKTLQEVFSPFHAVADWSENANYIITTLGESYSGKTNFKSLDSEMKIKNAFQAFNSVFNDTIEYSTSNDVVENAVELEFDNNIAREEWKYSINKKLLLSIDKEPMEYSGAVSEDTNPKSDKIFEYLLNNSFNRKVIEEKIRKDPANKTKNDSEIDKLVNKGASTIRKEIRRNWKKIYLVVTPLCDFVQKKNYNNRVLKGMLIKSEYHNLMDDKSEAIFVSPKFKYTDGENYVIVLNFRYFFTSNDQKGIKYINPVFRVRHQLLAEIQSRLARHITRQGILFVE
jgi:hypothetical protein